MPVSPAYTLQNHLFPLSCFLLALFLKPEFFGVAFPAFIGLYAFLALVFGVASHANPNVLK